MYDAKPNLVIGFHGCDRQVRDALLMNPNDFRISQQPYDWLGHGMYFWEDNYDRALEWATDKHRMGHIAEPAVIGGVLHLGYCFNLLDKRHIQILADHYKFMKDQYACLGKQLPKNKDLTYDRYKDRKLRHLDCAVIEFMHTRTLDQVISDVAKTGHSLYKIFDSTRGAFIEGGPAFEGAEIREKTHIQICIRNPNCIKGFFLPRHEIDFAPWLETTRNMSPAA